MIAELAGGLTATNALIKIVEGLNAANTQAKLNEVRVELSGKLLQVMAALNAALAAETVSADRIRDLEKEIVRLKDWEGEKKRYELKNIGGGAFGYMPKKGMDEGEPPHWLCANCFDRGHRSVLQFQKSVTDKGAPIDLYRCNDCKGELAVPYRIRPKWLWE